MASSIDASTSGAGGVITTADNTGILQLKTAGTTAVTVDASQNVGIGTTSPKKNAGWTTLTLNNASQGGVVELTNNGTTIGQLYNDGSNVYLYSTSAKNISLVASGAAYISALTNGSERMRIDSSGNVGIGTSSPSSQLAVQTTAGSSTGFLKFTDVSYGGDVRFGKNTGISNDAIAGTWTANNMLFYTNSSERMRIDSSGYFSIRQTSNSGGEVLGIQGNGDTQIGLYCTPTTLYTQINFRNGNGVVGTVRTTGTSTQFNTSSDYRLKENVSPMEGALNKVMQLKPVTFTWKTDGLPGQGFIAHELQEIVPDAVGGEKDAVDKNGNPDYQGVDASFLVATLTKAIQELKAIVDAQQQEINALKGASL